jgi:hypothetical protein
MSINLVKHIVTEVMKFDQFFEQRRNAAGELGHNTYQKVTAALRMLAYGIPADLIDDNLAMGESTAIYYMCQALCRSNCAYFWLYILESPQCSRYGKTFGV